MVTACAVDSSVTQLPVLQTSETRPPRPPCGLTAVLLDEYDTGSELVVAIDTNDIMTVQLHARGLDVGGAAHAATWRFQNQSVFALAEIALTGYDTIAERRVDGTVSIGLTWNPASDGLPARVAGSALAEGTWLGGLFRFTTVVSHDFDSGAIRLISTESFPAGLSRFCGSGDRRGRGNIFRLGPYS